jgi:hypothetical protein
MSFIEKGMRPEGALLDLITGTDHSIVADPISRVVPLAACAAESAEIATTQSKTVSPQSKIAAAQIKRATI